MVGLGQQDPLEGGKPMGGHTQYGEFHTIDEAIKVWKETTLKCVNGYHLWLRSGQIIYDDESKLYKLAMRFSK